ncbi:shikimate kinase [Nonomuraea montanisoli]|uniref:shikimate kinase n=1 Tax=Nonomuraea montanisoli TaxID=2741721 RepID=UPI0015883629|nr:shikimate kinase [Nonomuraea montanisoli]
MVIPYRPPQNGRVTDTPWMVLIGPAAAGKSTLGALLAASTGRRFVDVDEVGGAYYAEAGWTMARLRERIQAVGRVAAEREWEPARAHAVRRALAAHPAAIVALGAGHSHYTDQELFEAVRCALAPVPHVILVLPCARHDRSVEVLRHRSISVKGTDWINGDGHDLLDEWVRWPGNALLATATVHTDGEKPVETVDRLLSMCGAHPEVA